MTADQTIWQRSEPRPAPMGLACVNLLDKVRPYDERTSGTTGNPSMLYKFKSKATGDLIMLQTNGRRVLQIIGKDGSPEKGIILPEQMSAAIQALQVAVAQEESEQAAAVAEALARHETPPRFEAIGLRQRTQPFIEMLRRCEKAEKEIVWGV